MPELAAQPMVTAEMLAAHSGIAVESLIVEAVIRKPVIRKAVIRKAVIRKAVIRKSMIRKSVICKSVIVEPVIAHPGETMSVESMSSGHRASAESGFGGCAVPKAGRRHNDASEKQQVSHLLHATLQSARFMHYIIYPASPPPRTVRRKCVAFASHQDFAAGKIGFTSLTMWQ